MLSSVRSSSFELNLLSFGSMLVVTINKARKNPKPTGFVGYPVCPGLSYQIDLDALPGVGPRIGECWSAIVEEPAIAIELEEKKLLQEEFTEEDLIRTGDLLEYSD